MKVNDIIHGFRIDRVRDNEELGGKLWEMTHIKTDAELVWLDNGQSNKVFAIAFKTIPQDDTGVFHILEHTVLNGSEKYPVKEPFLDMLKGSMQTFLNAMTFPDKTLYPVSSQNEQDFMNLSSVYLDAVFCPQIYNNPNVFYQEGWHYELAEAGSEPIYNGVVFNEMKGALSSVDDIMNTDLCKMLFKDTCYKYVSGGDPVHIPELTYEAFIDAHKEFYHPTNSKIYLDGSVPLDRILKLIDEEYLSKYEKSDKVHEIRMQDAAMIEPMTSYYEIGKEDDESNKTQLVYGKVLCDWSDSKKIMAANVMASYLTDSNASVLKRAVLESGMAQDVEMYIADGIQQPYTAVAVRNTELEHKDEIYTIITDTIKQLCKEGLDSEELTAELNRLEFMLKEIGEPKGIQRSISVMSTWLYGGDPLEGLIIGDLIDQLRDEIGTGYYENLLKEIFLEKEGRAELYVLPSKTKGEEDRAAEQQRLQAESAQWTDEKRQGILALNHGLQEWQEEPDSAEAKATLPELSINDIEELPEETKTIVSKNGDVTMLYHPLDCSGIVHINMYFSISDMEVKRISDLSFLCSILGELPTEKYTAAQLQQEIKKNLGSLKFSIANYEDPKKPEICRPFFVASVSVLEKNIQVAIDLVMEIVKNTKFTDKDAIRHMVLQGYDDMYQDIIEQGNQIASVSVLKNYSSKMAMGYFADGYGMYQYMTDFKDNYESRIEGFIEFVQSVLGNIFTEQRLTVSHTADKEHDIMATLKSHLTQGEAVPSHMEIQLSRTPDKEAIQIPAGICYAAYGGSLDLSEEEAGGSLKVLSRMLGLSYLWNEIRVKGGAYGTGCGINEAGNIAFTTFRDPSPIASVETFKATGDFLDAFCETDEKIDNFIISSIAASQPLQTPRRRGMAADAEYFMGITFEDRCRQRKDMLEMKKSDLVGKSRLFEKLNQNASTCIVGHEEIIAQLGEEWKVYQL